MAPLPEESFIIAPAFYCCQLDLMGPLKLYVPRHNMNGLAEWKIRPVSESLEAAGILKMRLHANGFLTVLKLIKSDLNNLLFSYSYRCSQENSSMLELIFPTLLRIGRSNSLALDGPIMMPKDPGELMDGIIGAYESFFKVWNTSLIL